MKADTAKPPAKRRQPTDGGPLEVEIARVRAREERRLIRAAEKAGYFRFRVRAAEAVAVIKAGMEALEVRSESTLTKLERRKTRIAKTKRANDARIKAILGSFLVAQCQHKPELHAAVAPAIRQSLEEHPDRSGGQRSLALLAGFLSNPWHDGVSATPSADDQGTSSERTRRTNSHRLIVLGVWLLEQRERPDIAELIDTELRGFLEIATRPLPDEVVSLLADQAS